MKVPAGWKLVPICPYHEEDSLAEQWGRGFSGKDNQKAARGSPAERAWLEGGLAAHAIPPDDSADEPSEEDRREFERHFTARTYHSLRGAGILSFPLLRIKSRNDLLKLPNFGNKSWKEVQIALQKKYPEIDEGDA